MATDQVIDVVGKDAERRNRDEVDLLLQRADASMRVIVNACESDEPDIDAIMHVSWAASDMIQSVQRNLQQAARARREHKS